MTGLSKFLGRGLLVLALGCSVGACGDDDDDGPAPDAGAGSGGSGGSKAGSGGSKAGTGGMAGTMQTSGDITKAECIEMAKDTTGNMAKASCYDCLCGMKPQETAECTADCWKLANCAVTNGCGTDVNCIVAECTDDLGDSMKLAAAGTLARATPFTACADDCFEAEGDADTDAGK